MNRGKARGVSKRRGWSTDGLLHAEARTLAAAPTRRRKTINAWQRRILAMVATGSPLPEVLTELVRAVETHSRGMLGSVLLADEESGTLRHGAAPSLPEAYNRAVDGTPIGPRSGSCGTAAWRGKRVVVEDIATDPLWEGGRSIAAEHSLKACWSQPILAADGRVLGTFAMYYQRARGPSLTDIDRIEAAAHLGGIAIERHCTDEKQRMVERRLRAQGAVLTELAKSDELAREDFEGFVRLALERSTTTLGVERAGIWFFNGDRSILRCEDLYEASLHRHSSGQEIQSSHYKGYFRALGHGRLVAAHDARTDPATQEFSESYLTPLGITSMLDAPLRRSGRLIGVVCHEHVGAPREWAVEEQEFAASIAEFVSLALETSERRAAEDAFRAAQEELFLHQQQERLRVDTEIERLKHDLVRQTRFATIGQVAVSIAHELRNPLAALRNAAYYLRRRAGASDPKWEEYLGIIEQEVRQADRIVSDLMDMSRAREPARRVVDLGTATAEAFAYLEDRSALELVLESDPDPFTLMVDPDQLRQVLTNLLTNAAQAMGGRGRITVKAWREEGTDAVTVADDGPGVPGHIRDQIFEPLFTTKAKGTGLGLAICRQIVERHGGAIDLAPTARGAAFRIRIPAPRAG